MWIEDRVHVSSIGQYSCLVGQERWSHLDRDMELRVWFKGHWNNKVKQDLRKGTAAS